MQITVNGQKESLAGKVTLLSFLEAKDIDLNTVVVEYNFNIIPKEQWGDITLQEGDNLEVLHFVGGG
ncbi:sulfur carrier protein ThiS [Desulfofalx alkaliphila]|uniref:sulfur carrier protein ThiS n=1 Tax=Desulfofalx alkaliphila TaxID=105483 RepID=UPI0004E1AD37|nr:sulfur carrier protein ThiS [Desulfofalx alkaliphila]